MPSKLWIPQPPEGLPRRRLADLLGIEIEMPVDFAAPVTHAATPQILCLGAPLIVFVVVYGNMDSCIPESGFL